VSLEVDHFGVNAVRHNGELFCVLFLRTAAGNDDPAVIAGELGMAEGGDAEKEKRVEHGNDAKESPFHDTTTSDEELAATPIKSSRNEAKHSIHLLVRPENGRSVTAPRNQSGVWLELFLEATGSPATYSASFKMRKSSKRIQCSASGGPL